MGDKAIYERIHRNRLRPYHLFATNAASYTDMDDPLEIYYYPRSRCPTCWMYDANCRLIDDREGAQPARLLLHNHRLDPKRPPYLFTGTASKMLRWDACGVVGLDAGEGSYGRCRSKETQAQIAMGHVSLTRAVISGRHNERIPIASESSNVYADEVTTYEQEGTAVTAFDWLRLGYADPTGSRPLAHYDTCLRFNMTIPANAIITRARLSLWRNAAQTGSAFIKAFLLDRDDMGAFVLGAGTEADNPRRGNASGPARLNVNGGTTNEYEIEVGSGSASIPSWFELPTDIIAPIVNAFIARPGYDPAGSYIGIALESDRDKNTTTSNQVQPIAYRTESGGDEFAAELLISWREAGSDGKPKASTPPKINGYLQFTNVSSPVPAEGTWPEEIEGIDAGEAFSGWPGDKMPDIPWANCYRHIFMLQVDPLLTWWNEVEFGPAPYPENAHETFALEDCDLYEIPCYSRVSPWRYRTLGDSLAPKVRGGLPGIIGFSSAPAQYGYFPPYFDTPGDCAFGGYNYESVIENTWRTYWGQTRPKTHVWTADTLRRGWSVTYTAYLRAWFVLDSNFEGICYSSQTHAIGNPETCMFRWNVWYTIEIRARFSRGSDPENATFKAWVKSHEAAFGATVTPRYSQCNDVLCRCAGVEQAMGDQIWPAAACQDDLETRAPYGAHYPPCKQKTGGYSYWYLPDYNSNHIKTPLAGPRIGAYPENLLYHEVAAVRKLNAAGTETDTHYSWSRLGLTTNIPWLLAVDTEYTSQNAIHRLSVVNDNECESPPATGYFTIGWGDDEEFWSEAMPYNATAAQVRDAIVDGVASFEPGDIAVTGADGGPWDVEYLRPAGFDVPLPTLKSCSIQDAYGCEFSVDIEVVQSGVGG